MDGAVHRAGLDSTWVLTLLTLLGVTGIWKNPVTIRPLKTHLLGCYRDKAEVGASIFVKAEPRGTPPGQFHIQMGNQGQDAHQGVTLLA